MPETATAWKMTETALAVIPHSYLVLHLKMVRSCYERAEPDEDDQSFFC